MMVETKRSFTRFLLASLFAVLLAGLFGTSAFTAAFAQRVGSPATDFIAGGEWLNSEPLHVGDLRGKVVLVNVWVSSCYNCTRSLPSLKKWYQAYQDRGFEIVGVHTPEFESDKPLANVQEALKREAVSWPVMQDNNAATWRAYKNSVWPTFYLIDREGVVRRVQRGEVSSTFPAGIKPLENAIETLVKQ